MTPPGCSRRAGVALLLAAIAATSGAQTLRGVVRDSSSRQPLAGAVVMLLDSSGAVLGRNVTDEGGRYGLALPLTARFARIVRIGFRQRELRVRAAMVGATALDVTLAPVPTMLASVRVRGESHCPRRRDAEAAFGLWEHAQAGLLATVVARENSRASMHRLVYASEMEGNSSRIAQFVVEADSLQGAEKSFNTAYSAGVFAKSGFASDSAGVTTLFGPDADVLLDDAFAGAYCFRIAEPQRSRPNQVGLAFAPADAPRGRVDIDGTLWIDTVARALRDIEFRYLGLPGHTDQFRPGGRISFRQMPNGATLVDRWYLRGAAAAQRVRFEDRLAQRGLWHAIENGGELESAAWPSGETWHASLGRLLVHAVTSRGRPAAGIAFALPDTPYGGTTDANGDAAIDDLLPGPYSLEIVDPRIAKLGTRIPTPVRFAADRETTIQATLPVPTTEEYIAARCERANQWRSGDSVFVLGRVVTARGEPVRDADVTMAVRSDKGELNPLGRASRTGDDGLFQSCSPIGDLGVTAVIRVRRHDVDLLETSALLARTLTVVLVLLPPPK